jgi:hypothetical protein
MQAADESVKVKDCVDGKCMAWVFCKTKTTIQMKCCIFEATGCGADEELDKEKEVDTEIERALDERKFEKRYEYLQNEYRSRTP